MSRLPTEALRLDRSGEIPDGIGLVFDLAGYGNMHWQTDVAETYRANLGRVIYEMNNLNGAKYIYISTSSVNLPVQTPYSLSKKAAEEYLKITDKKVAIVRPFSITGVGEQKEHLIPKLLNSCMNGTPMNFVPDPVHDFLDVEDFIDALMLIHQKGLFEGEIYEVGSGCQRTNEEVKNIVEKVTGKKANITYVPNLRRYDTKEWRANTERICSLGWAPKISLEQSIQKMYARKTTEHL